MRIYFTILLALLTLTSCSSYVRRAYWGKSEGTSIRGYPTIDPPKGYTGVWTHYKYDGNKLAEIPYMNGKFHGTSFWYRDDGSVYLIRHYEDGAFAKDYFIVPPPKEPARIPIWYPAHYKRSALPTATRSNRRIQQPPSHARQQPAAS